MSRKKRRSGHSGPDEMRQKWAEREARSRAAKDIVKASFPAPSDPDMAWTHFLRMMSYEGWLEAGRPELDDFTIEEWPPVYVRFFEQWPDAFQYYRHHAFSYVSGALGLLPWGQVVHSLLSRLRAGDPAGYERLIEVLQASDERFLRQRRQATQSLYLTPLPEEPADRLLTALTGYCRLYETDLPLWLLGVIGKGLQEGVLDPDFLGGPETRTPQGSLVDTVQQRLAGTPLEDPFRGSYDSVLRNAVSHNDHEVIEEAGDLVVVDHDTGTRWFGDEAWDRIVAAQHIHQAVVLAAQLAMARQVEPPTKFRDIGVLSATYQVSDVGPIVLVPQLWCFRDLDPDGVWLDESTLTLTMDQDGGVGAFTDNATTSGPPFGSEYIETLEERGWITVIRIPVAPAIGLELPTITTMDGETLEVVGPRDEHLIPVEVVPREA